MMRVKWEWDFSRMFIVMSVKPTLTDELLTVNSTMQIILSVIEDQCSGGQRIAPCKGIQESRGFWIPHCGFRIPGTGFRIPAQWIPDSQEGWIPHFFVCVLMLFFAFRFRVRIVLF